MALIIVILAVDTGHKAQGGRGASTDLPRRPPLFRGKTTQVSVLWRRADGEDALTFVEDMHELDKLVMV